MRRLPLSALLLLAGCATLTEADSQPTVMEAAARAHGGGTWRELRSAHFTLDTDLSPAHAQKVIERLERLRTALLTAAWGKAQIEGDHLDAIVLETHKELAEFADENVAGYVHHGNRLLFVGAGSDLDAQKIFAHELTHVFASRLLQRQPLWFSEGLAKFLETVNLKDDGTAELGDADLDTVTELNRRGRLPAARVLAFSAKDLEGMEGSEVGGFYRTAWLLVHYLFNTRSQDFRRYQVALAKGEDPARAWSELFADLTPDKLDHELTLYLRYGQYRVFDIPLPAAGELAAQTRELPDPEIRAVRAKLFLVSMGTRSAQERRALAQQELAPALKAAPENPRVLEIAEGWLSPAELLADARASTAKYADDPRAWRVLADALKDDATEPGKSERLKAMARAAELDPSDAFTLNNWAWELVTSGKPEQALGPARKAASLDPDPSVLDTLGVTLASLGQCGEALATEQRAIDLVPPEVKGHREALAQHLAQMQQQCAPK